MILNALYLYLYVCFLVGSSMASSCKDEVLYLGGCDTEECKTRCSNAYPGLCGFCQDSHIYGLHCDCLCDTTTCT
ncbi:hypothetical protein HanRHA438_Chr05g0226031 [Helianthus annuus]|nr:hypothetical protein HanIR_Chr05g0233211 [Helianthus annuus]KAJ0919122.1 hypothetical protein HanRHA438_Chr05g0226031 [Helianthus annuus]